MHLYFKTLEGGAVRNLVHHNHISDIKEILFQSAYIHFSTNHSSPQRPRTHVRVILCELERQILILNACAPFLHTRDLLLSPTPHQCRMRFNSHRGLCHYTQQHAFVRIPIIHNRQLLRCMPNRHCAPPWQQGLNRFVRQA